MPAEPSATPAPRPSLIRRVLSIRNLVVASVVHSVLFTGLMICAFAIGKPQPATFIFGLSHGIMFPAMGLAAIVAARLRIIRPITAIMVAALGVVCPYFGTWELRREDRDRVNPRRTPVV